MPNTINSREEEAVKIQEGMCTLHHTLWRGRRTVCRETTQWGEHKEVLTEVTPPEGQAWGSARSLVSSSGYPPRQGLDLVSVGCWIHQPFLGLETIVTSEKQQRSLPVTLIEQAWDRFISTVTLEGTCCRRSHFTKENKTPRGQIACTWPLSN